MLRLLNTMFSSGPLSVRVSRKLLIVTDVATGTRWEDEPLVAIKSGPEVQPMIAAIGKDARSAERAGCKVVNPFDHPRILVADFAVGEKLMRHAFLSVLKRKWIGTAPRVVIQVTEKLEGGVSEIEWRALQEMVAGAGANGIFLAKSRPLSDSEIKAGFPKKDIH